MTEAVAGVFDLFLFQRGLIHYDLSTLKHIWVELAPLRHEYASLDLAGLKCLIII